MTIPYAEAEKLIGICTECGEHTSLADACCGAPVYCEGGFLDPNDVEEESER